MISEVRAVEFKLDAYSLPPLALCIDASFGLAIRKRGVDSLNDKAQFVADHAEQENNALLIDRCVPKTTKVDWWAELRAITFAPGYLFRQRRLPEGWRSWQFMFRLEMQFL